MSSLMGRPEEELFSFDRHFALSPFSSTISPFPIVHWTLLGVTQGSYISGGAMLAVDCLC